MNRTTKLLAGSLLLLGPSLASTPDEDRASLASLLDAALESCCAAETCSDEGGCMAPCDACETGACNTSHVSPPEAFVKAVTKTPYAFSEARPLIEARFLAEDAADGDRALLVGMLTWCKGDDVVACGERLFEAEPASFTSDHVLAFAAQGSRTFLADLAGRAESGEVRPCAYFALEGEDDRLRKTARKTLERVAKAREVSAETLADQLLAAHALAQVENAEPLTDLRTRIHAAVIAALDGGEVDLARDMALIAEYFARLGKVGKGGPYGKTLGLSHMGFEMRVHCTSRSKEVATADAVFELIERITPM